MRLKATFIQGGMFYHRYAAQNSNTILHNRQNAEQKTSKSKHVTPTTTTENENQHWMTDSQEPKADIKPLNHYFIRR
jgi:hypothetical protein